MNFPELLLLSCKEYQDFIDLRVPGHRTTLALLATPLH